MSESETRTEAITEGGAVATFPDPETLTYDDRGLLPVIVQGVTSGAVLMQAWANREALERSRASGRMWFWSRSRRVLWMKGETSGNVLRVIEAHTDCDRDSLLVRAHPAGPTCHRGTRSCFEPNSATLELGWLAEVLGRRARAGGEESYTARLLAAGVERVAQKVGEEGVETALAGVATGDDERLVSEAADLLYHLLVLLEARGVSPERVGDELRRRHEKPAPPAMEEGS